MSNQILKTVTKVSSALLAVSILAATPAAAKIKDIKFHFIQSGAYGSSPVMEMKFQQGKWTWLSKSAKVPVKVKIDGHPEYFKIYAFDHKGHNKQTVYSKEVPGKNFEKVVNATFPASYFKKNISAAKNLCGVFGGKNKVVRDMPVKTLLQAFDNHKKKNSGYKYGKVNVKVVCHPKKLPNSAGTGAFALKIKDLKLSTVPAKPKCGQPFKLVTNLKTNIPAKVSLKLLRNNGMSQNFTIQPKKSNGGHSGIWFKNYNLKKTEKRSYKVIVNGKAIQTPWHTIDVKCVGGQNGGLQN